MSSRDDRIRAAVAHLAEAVGDALPYEELPKKAVRTFPPVRRPWLVVVAAAVVVLVAVGLPIMVLNSDRAPEPAVPTPTTVPPVVTSIVEPTDTNPPVTTVAPPTSSMGDVDVTSVPWVRAQAFVGVVDPTGRTLELDLVSGPKPLAWDLADGLVYLTSGGDLRRITPRGDVAVTRLEASDIGSVSLSDVVVLEGREVAVLSDPAGGATWIDLITGDEVPGPSDVYSGDAVVVAGMTARVEEVDLDSVSRGEAGEPLPPYPLPMVVVTTADGAEVLRVEIGSEERPFATIHDFDGRRLIVSAEPFEPALPPRTVYVFDLACEACTEVIEAGGSAEWFELTGGPTASQPDTTLFIRAGDAPGTGDVDGRIVVESPLEVTGGTEPGAVVTVNGEPTAVDDAGSFAAEVDLVEGANTVLVEAVAGGSVATASLEVTYVPGAIVEFAYIDRVGAGEVIVDGAEWLTGDDAVQAALDDGAISSAEEGVPGDYYIRNADDSVRTLSVAEGVVVILVGEGSDGGLGPVAVSRDEWLALFKADGTPWDIEVDGELPEWPAPHFGYFGAGTVHAPYWITIDGAGTAIQVEQQYLP